MPPWSRRRWPKPIVPDVFNYFQFPDLRPPEIRDWAELPLDAILYILRKLDQVELLKGGVATVCSSWRRAARDEPDLWRRINIGGPLPSRLDNLPSRLDHLARGSVCLSVGLCEEFCSQCLHDDSLLFIAERAPLLRRLSLKLCYRITNEGFAAAITNIPLLEELELEHCHGIDDTGVLKHVARSCPRMKHITHINCNEYDFYFSITDPSNDREALAIASMPELRTLQLFHDKLTNIGLASIIDNCPHLESIDLRNCLNITVDDALRAKCARIKKKTLLLPDFVDYRGDFETGSAISPCSLWTSGFSGTGDGADTADKYIGDDDSVSNESRDSYCYYLGEEGETNVQQYDRILDKSMRRYKM